MSESTGDLAPTRRTKTLLLTVLGSVAAPNRLALWQETYVHGLAQLGARDATARQTLSRAVSAGWLTRERVGRRTRLHVPEEHRIGLAKAAERVADFGRPIEWNGEWLIVTLKVPEQARAVRHHFRTALGWLGFGSLGNGVWISPHTQNEASTLELLAGAEDISDVHVFRAARSVDEPSRLAQSAWDMDSLRARYTTFLARFGDAAPSTPEAIWKNWIELVTAWRHFPLFDPELPDHLLPPNWPRANAYRLFHDLDARWAGPALEHLVAIEESISV